MNPITFFYEANNIGFLGSFFCFLLIIFITYHQRPLLNRTSIRMLFLLSFTDLMRHLSLFIQYRDLTESTCTFIGLMNMYTNALFVVLTVMMTYLLQANFINLKRFNGTEEKKLWMIIAAVPLLLTLPLLASNIIGREGTGACFLNKDHPNYRIVYLTNIIIPYTLAVVYCLFVGITMVTRAVKDTEMVSNFLAMHGIKSSFCKGSLQRALRNWILRFSLYPLLFCVLAGGVLLDLFSKYIFGFLSNYTVFWSFYSFCFYGLAMGFSFVVDPFFNNGFYHAFFIAYRPKQPRKYKEEEWDTECALTGDKEKPEEEDLDHFEIHDVLLEILRYC